MKIYLKLIGKQVLIHTKDGWIYNGEVLQADDEAFLFDAMYEGAVRAKQIIIPYHSIHKIELPERLDDYKPKKVPDRFFNEE